MSFDHWRSSHDPEEYRLKNHEEYPEPPPKTMRKKRNCYQINPTLVEPPVIGWGVERCLNLRLRDKYQRIIWMANEVYHYQHILTLDDSARAAEGVTKTDVEINEHINDIIKQARVQRDGNFGCRACCDQVVRAGGKPILLPNAIENALTEMLGHPPPLPDSPVTVPIWGVSRTSNTIRITNQHLRYPARYLEENHLNRTLQKVYKCMAIMVNEIWDRENREDHGPPTVVVETNALRLKLRKMKVVADKIILRISQSNEEHFPMPDILSAAVSNLTKKILE